MRKILFLFTIALVLNSCGSSHSFSKRQHLKGHFWKKSGGNRSMSKHKTEERSNDAFEDRTQKEFEKSNSAAESISSADEQTVADEIVKAQKSKKLSKYEEARSTKPKVVHFKPIKVSSKKSRISHALNRSSKMGENTFWRMLFFIWIALGVAGATLIVLWFVLSIDWLLVLGIIFIGIFGYSLYLVLEVL